MRLAILGATGRVGRHLTEAALSKGHKVVGIMRNMPQTPVEHPDLVLKTGDVRNEVFLEKALLSADAVLSALGDRNLNNTISLMSEAMTHTISAMKKLGIRRIIAVAGAGILQHDEHALNRDQPLFPSFLRNVSADHLNVFYMLKSSGLDWTLVCPPQIVLEPSDGNVKTLADYFPNAGPRIFAGDLANFMVDEITNNKFLCRRVGIAN